MNADIARLHISYDRDTGKFNRVLVSGGVLPGAINNIPGGDGYIAIRVCGKKYKAHRLAWLLVNGKWPEEEIDHINGVKTDNRYVNLRDVSKSENMRNQYVAHKGSESGLIGAYKDGGMWRAQIKKDGVSHSVGWFKSKEEAHQAYLKAKADMHGIVRFTTGPAA